jgi:hypothetical protein
MEEQNQGVTSARIAETEIAYWNRYAVRRMSREFAIDFAVDRNAIQRFSVVVSSFSVPALKVTIDLKDSLKRHTLIVQLKNILNMLWDAAPIVEYEELFKDGYDCVEEHLTNYPEWRIEIAKALFYIEKELEYIQLDSLKNEASATREREPVKWLGSREEFQKLCKGLVPRFVSEESLRCGVFQRFDFSGNSVSDNEAADPIHWKGSRKQLARLYFKLLERGLIRESQNDFYAAFVYLDRKTAQWKKYTMNSFRVAMSEMKWMDPHESETKSIDAVVDQLS